MTDRYESHPLGRRYVRDMLDIASAVSVQQQLREGHDGARAAAELTKIEDDFICRGYDAAAFGRLWSETEVILDELQKEIDKIYV